MPEIAAWLKDIDLFSLFLGAFIGAIISTWYGYYIKRPVLKVSGAIGGEIFRGFSGEILNVTNSPGILGVQLSETRILGLKIHGDIRKGIAIERDTAHSCTAWLYDKESKRCISGLFWRSRKDGSKCLTKLSLESRESADLMIFIVLKEGLSKYLVYRPISDLDLNPKTNGVPQFSDSREFYVEIQYARDMRRLRFDYKVVREFDRRLSFESPFNGTSMQQNA